GERPVHGAHVGGERGGGRQGGEQRAAADRVEAGRPRRRCGQGRPPAQGERGGGARGVRCGGGGPGLGGAARGGVGGSRCHGVSLQGIAGRPRGPAADGGKNAPVPPPCAARGTRGGRTPERPGRACGERGRPVSAHASTAPAATEAVIGARQR